jgi:hypothetical protein
MIVDFVKNSKRGILKGNFRVASETEAGLVE